MARIDSHDPRQAALESASRRKAEVLADAYLPHLAPAALKHESLAAIANVIKHHDEVAPVDTTNERGEPLRKIIGYGDWTRRHPLVLIARVDPADSTRFTVFHAFVPNIGDPIERQMVKDLQGADERWTRARGLEHGRPLYTELAKARDMGRVDRRLGLEAIALSGVSDYPGATDPFLDEDHADRASWFASRPLSVSEQIQPMDYPAGQRPRVDRDDRVVAAIEDNVLGSLNLQARDVAEHSALLVERPLEYTRVALDEYHRERNRLHVGDLETRPIKLRHDIESLSPDPSLDEPEF